VAFFQLIIYYSGFFAFVFAERGSVCPEGYAALSQGWLWGTVCCFFAHLMVCICQAGQELVPGRAGALLVSLYLLVWGNYMQAGCRNFASSWWFFLPGVSSASQPDFYFKEQRLAASSH
jgi:hypothetical protein